MRLIPFLCVIAVVLGVFVGWGLVQWDHTLEEQRKREAERQEMLELWYTTDETHSF